MINSNRYAILIGFMNFLCVLPRAANGARTRDPWLGKPMLYQLSYCRNSDANVVIFFGCTNRLGVFFVLFP